VALQTALRAKGLPLEFVEQTPSLSLPLATRSGQEVGPWLRTTEGFVLADVHRILDWIERVHPDPPLMPTRPVGHVCARLLEDWIELWLPLWPRRSWETLDRIGEHLARSGFLLGRTPSRPDWWLAAWLEVDVLGADGVRAHLVRRARRLTVLSRDLLDVRPVASTDDVIPISLLPLLEEIARDYHTYLRETHRGLKDRVTSVVLDLGDGPRRFPVRHRCEERRVEIGQRLAAGSPEDRLAVRRVLEPVGAWSVFTLPPATRPIDIRDPRAL
jgi:glutathione S-transferase